MVALPILDSAVMDFVYHSNHGKENKVYLQAGAGIVDSAGNGIQECCNKVMALAKTLVEEENL